MKRLKPVLKVIFDIFEIYIPTALFFVIFVFYIIMIVQRRVFLTQSTEIYELSVIIFSWCSFFAISYGARIDKHIMFTVIYDKLSDRGQVIFRIVSNLFIVVIFAIFLPYAYKSIILSNPLARSSILNIPNSVIRAPFISAILLTNIHLIMQMTKDIKTFFKSSKKGAKL